MSQMAQEQVDTVDRARMSWILNLIFNQKTQQEIVKDIADGILDFKEIEDIFPWKFVQKLRRFTPENTQNYLNRFKNMTDERMRGLVTLMLNRKSRDEIHKLITDHSLNLDNIQKSFIRRHIAENEENESSATSNVSTSSEKLSSRDRSDTDVTNSKKPKDTDTKKKRNRVKKSEKDTDAKKKESNVEKATKENRVVKLSVGNKVGETSKEISLMEQNPLARMYGETTSKDLTGSLMETGHEGFEESSLKSTQGDRAACKLPARRDTKKTVTSKSLASKDAKLASVKKVSKKVGKDVKAGVRNMGKQEVENFASLSRSDDYVEEKEKSRSEESDVENENTGTSYAIENDRLPKTRSNEEFENSLQKSRTNQITDVIDGEQPICGNKENELNQFREYNYNMQLGTSTPKKINCETKMIRIKEEPQSECSFNEYDDYPIDSYKEKVLNINSDCVKKVNFQKTLETKESKVRSNLKLSNADVSRSKKIKEPPRVAKVEKNRSRGKSETTRRQTKDARRKQSTEDRRMKTRKLDRKDRRRKEKTRRHERKMQKAMAQFSDQVVKLVKNMGYLEKGDEFDDDSSSCSSGSSYSSSTESSYSSSSESCSCSSCSCCDYSTSDEYSEYTLCSCSNCDSSCSSSDSNYEKEE